MSMSKSPSLSTITEFYERCERLDWTFEFSDDHRVWQRGKTAREALDASAAIHPLLGEIKRQWALHIFSGPAYGCDRAPKPVLVHFLSAVEPLPAHLEITDDPDQIQGQLRLTCN